MYTVFGATGHIGSVVASTLLAEQKPVTVITRDQRKAAEWNTRGASAAVVDVRDSDKLREVLAQSTRVFVLNPPGSPAGDMIAEEEQTITAILKAMNGLAFEKVVVASTYGATPKKGIGDMSTLYQLEQGLTSHQSPVSIIRSGYYMSNWKMSLATARDQGKLYSFYPDDFKLGMVAPEDIGQFAAQVLGEDETGQHLYYFEGPEAYTPAEVAAAFGHALDRDVVPVSIPRDQWISSMQEMGFSEKSAKAMAAMTASVIDKTYQLPQFPNRGTTTIQRYIQHQVMRVRGEDVGD